MNNFLKIFIVIFGIIIVIAAVSIHYLNNLTKIQHQSEVKIDNQIIVADVVSSDADKAKGLGGRDSIGINEGMLFLFNSPGDYGFWMKDMKFPIDIVWIAQGQVVGFEENVDPQIGAADSALKVYYPPTLVDQVLELHAGRVSLLKAAVGDAIKARPLINTQSLLQ